MCGIKKPFVCGIRTKHRSCASVGEKYNVLVGLDTKIKFLWAQNKTSFARRNREKHHVGIGECATCERMSAHMCSEMLIVQPGQHGDHIIQMKTYFRNNHMEEQ